EHRPNRQRISAPDSPPDGRPTERRNAMKRLIAVIAASAVLLLGAAAPSFADAGDGTSCVSGRWPADVQGRPANLHSLGATGLYVWHDDNGWHLRVTHSSKTHVTFRG